DGFRLVDLDMLLQRMNQVFLQVARRERLVGDLAKCDHGVLVVVAIDGDRRALGDLARTMTGQKNQLEAVLDLVDAILNGNAGHLSPLSLVELSESLPVHIANGAEKQASCSKPANLPSKARSHRVLLAVLFQPRSEKRDL